MSTALGYHLTFHPYGTWLPGDERGWTERGGDGSRREPNRQLEGIAREGLLGPPLRFDERQRSVVDRTIIAVGAHRGWRLHALVVHSDHVHLVVTPEVAPERVVSTLKSWSTRRLREEELVAETARVWARHGSTRYLGDERRMVVAIEYVIRQGGRRLSAD